MNKDEKQYFYTATIFTPDGGIDTYDVQKYVPFSAGMELIDMNGNSKIYWNVQIVLEKKEK